MLASIWLQGIGQIPLKNPELAGKILGKLVVFSFHPAKGPRPLAETQPLEDAFNNVLILKLNAIEKCLLFCD